MKRRKKSDRPPKPPKLDCEDRLMHMELLCEIMAEELIRLRHLKRSKKGILFWSGSGEALLPSEQALLQSEKVLEEAREGF